MRPRDPNLERIELVAAALGPLREQLVFVGGCAAGLLITDPAAAPIRATLDVDLAVHVSVLAAYHRVEEEFAKRGFKRDMTRDAPICRWVYRSIEVDLMPDDARIIGFSNRWYPLTISTAQTYTLPRGVSILLVAAPPFLGTKFEAFRDRGKGDLLASHDLEDIISVIDGRDQALHEIVEAPVELRSYLAAECKALLQMKDFEYLLPAIVNDGDSPPLRADMVLQRLRSITESG